MLLNILQSTPNPFPETDLSNQKPYVDFIGREYRLITEVDAIAWNDFPDESTILTISLMPRPNVGQTIRIRSAKGRFLSMKHYEVSVPGAGLAEGIPILIYMDSEGRPESLVYEPTGR